jgi:uncharacterized protein
MNALYIHGLDSTPNLTKIGMMENRGLHTFAPLIDFRNNPDCYFDLARLIEREKIGFIAGSSLGGFMAYWLSHETGIPCLLMNPAMVHPSLEAINLPSTGQNRSEFMYVAIGELDDVIDPALSRRFFLENAPSSSSFRIISCNWLGHVIDHETFDELLAWALTGLENKRRNIL